MKSRIRFRSIVNRFCLEASLGMTFETLLGATTLTAFAGKVSIPLWIVMILNAMPWTGNIAQFFFSPTLAKVHSLRRTTVQISMLARALWIIPLSLFAYWGFKGGEFPYTQWFLIAVLTGTVSTVLLNTSTITWMSWTQALIPKSIRGRFFAARHRSVMGTLIAVHLLVAFLIDRTHNGFAIGFFLVLALAWVTGIGSSLVLSRISDVKHSYAHHSTALAPLRSIGFRKLLFIVTLFYFSIYIGAPYFPYYFTHDLGFSVQTVSLWIVISYFGHFTGSFFWGKIVDKTHHKKNIFLICAGIISLSPLLYALGSVALLTYLAPVEYFFNGMAWSGVLLSLNTLLFLNSPQENPRFFSIYQAAIGLSCGFSTLLGGQLLALFQLMGGYPSFWIFVFLVRASVCIYLVRNLAKSPHF